MRYIFNAFTEELEAPNNPSPLYENLGKRFKLTESVLPYDFDELTPKEEQYYQQDQFSTREDFLAAEGGLARTGFLKGFPGIKLFERKTQKADYAQKNIKNTVVAGTNKQIYLEHNLSSGSKAYLMRIYYVDIKGKTQRFLKRFSSLQEAKDFLPKKKASIAKELGMSSWEEVIDHKKTTERSARNKLPLDKRKWWTGDKLLEFFREEGLFKKRIVFI